jgi:hypothetical protein
MTQPTKRILTVIESPYAGNRVRNIIYARRALLDSLSREEAPFVSHLLYTQVLDDDDPIQRRWGINAGFSWHSVADLCAIYTDYGMSRGMEEGIISAQKFGLIIDYRKIGENT